MPGTRADNIITELATGSVVITRDLQYNNIRAEHGYSSQDIRKVMMEICSECFEDVPKKEAGT